jgi:hypothetical protein
MASGTTWSAVPGKNSRRYRGRVRGPRVGARGHRLPRAIRNRPDDSYWKSSRHRGSQERKEGRGRDAIEQLSTVAAREYLGTYTSRFWILDRSPHPNNLKLAHARGTKVVEMPSARNVFLSRHLSVPCEVLWVRKTQGRESVDQAGTYGMTRLRKVRAHHFHGARFAGLFKNSEEASIPWWEWISS